MRDTKTLYIIIGLLVVIGGGFFYFKTITSDLRSENFDLKEKEKVEIRKVRDSAFAKIEDITMRSNERFDSILSIPPIIKWKRYEKPVYIDRTLDGALDIHAKHKADKRAAK